MAPFDDQKVQILKDLDSGEPDLSPKGHVDVLCEPILAVINRHPDAVSTSSCSGRISIFQTGDTNCKKKSRGGGWLLVSHDAVTFDQVCNALQDLPQTPGFVFFKFEPFILHVLCRTLPVANALLTAAVGAGYRYRFLCWGGTGAAVGRGF